MIGRPVEARQRRAPWVTGPLWLVLFTSCARVEQGASPSTDRAGSIREPTATTVLDPQAAGLVAADTATTAEVAASAVRCGQEECTFPSAQPLRFRLVPGGQYRAGLSRPLYAPAREGIPERVSFAASPPRLVTVSRSFAVAASEVTVGQWRDLFGTEPIYQPRADCEDACPVDGVTWWSALAFADELSRAAGLPPCYTDLGVDCRGEPADGGLECRLDPHALKTLLWTGCQSYRLLTDAEWELAARGGTDTETYVGNQTFAKFEPRTVFASDIPSRRFGQARRDDPRWEQRLTRYWNDWCHDDGNVQTVAWYCRNAHVHARHCAPELNSQQLVSPTVCAGPQPVASLQPNAFGLYDMLGNVAEWTWDGGWYPGYDSFPVDPQVDPQVAPQSELRGVRGGSWSDGTIAAQVGMREHMTANVRWAGIRIGRNLPSTPATAE